jgi:hypothetical protein
MDFRSANAPSGIIEMSFPWRELKQKCINYVSTLQDGIKWYPDCHCRETTVFWRGGMAAWTEWSTMPREYCELAKN